VCALNDTYACVLDWRVFEVCMCFPFSFVGRPLGGAESRVDSAVPLARGGGVGGGGGGGGECWWWCGVGGYQW